MGKKIVDLREALFDTLEKVRTDAMPLEKAKQICDIAQTIINSANAETAFIKTVHATEGSGFMGIEDKKE